MGYFNKISKFLREYFRILSPDIPEFLEEYIDTDEMQRIDGTSMNVGVQYSGLYKLVRDYSNLDHSVGVALIVWHFTKDKKATLAGLFHDIATPTFKHCIDFMNGDYETQESTEERTTDIIKNSKKIMSLLERDGIKLEEINDYKLYPIADNDHPKLSADRLEYNFSGGFSLIDLWTLEDIKKCYDNMFVSKNEDGIDEIVFRDLDVCEFYIEKLSKLWPWWICDKDRCIMQFIADTCKEMNENGYLSINDLYTYSEDYVIDLILNHSNKRISNRFKQFMNIRTYYVTKDKLKNKYSVKIKSKKRYVNPLVYNKGRILDISSPSKKRFDEFYNSTNFDNYVSINIKEED
jgi:hypothetical protein